MKKLIYPTIIWFSGVLITPLCIVILAGWIFNGHFDLEDVPTMIVLGGVWSFPGWLLLSIVYLLLVAKIKPLWLRRLVVHCLVLAIIYTAFSIVGLPFSAKVDFNLFLVYCAVMSVPVWLVRLEE